MRRKQLRAAWTITRQADPKVLPLCLAAFFGPLLLCLAIGLVLGPLFEKALVQTSAVGEGSLAVVFTRPLALGILVCAVALIAVPRIAGALMKGRKANEKESVEQ